MLSIENLLSIGLWSSGWKNMNCTCFFIQKTFIEIKSQVGQSQLYPHEAGTILKFLIENF